MRYDTPDPTAQAASRDYSGIEARALLMMRATRDDPQRKRIASARNLLISAREWSPEQKAVIVRFVSEYLDIEDSNVPIAVGKSSMMGTVSDESLLPPTGPDGLYQEPIREVSLGQDPNSTESPEGENTATSDPNVVWAPVLERARAALAEGRSIDAIKELDTVIQPDSVSGYASLRKESVDNYVFQERERAARLFLEAREKSGSEKGTALEEVRGLLELLLKDYPQSSYAAAIQKNLRKVEQEIERQKGSR